MPAKLFVAQILARYQIVFKFLNSFIFVFYIIKFHYKYAMKEDATMFKTILTVTLLIISLIAFYFYFSNKLPAGVEPKGNEVIVAQISLWTAIIFLIGAILSFINTILEITTNKRK